MTKVATESRKPASSNNNLSALKLTKEIFERVELEREMFLLIQICVQIEKDAQNCLIGLVLPDNSFFYFPYLSLMVHLYHETKNKEILKYKKIT